ncbi:S-adenosyl-L-methionine-dependent methyltransferase [Xylariales sp. PMI_506]|nr:S-adenosyl-L-methionine-dependent methyltransferase [Xylariales sp. PMI_506]
MATQEEGNSLPDQEILPKSNGGLSRGFWHVPLPVLPSELLNSYTTNPAPSQIFSEGITPDLQQPSSTALNLPSHMSVDKPISGSSDPSFAAIASDLSNQVVDRTPTESSVVDPESIIGESLRLYHGYKDGKYFLPNDAAEQNRLDLQYEMLRILYDGWITLAPLSKAPKYVLDIGTGTGLWAFEFAEQNPSSYVIGADLSAIQPTNRVSPNVEFIKTDIEDDWAFRRPSRDHRNGQDVSNSDHKISFDYIHLRLMVTCFNDPRIVMKHAFDNMSSGGWIEFQEAFFESRQANPGFEGNAMQRWCDKCAEGALTVGRDLRTLLKYKQWLEDIGFVDVTERRLLIPAGEWPTDPRLKLAGKYCGEDILSGIRGVGYKMLRLAGMTSDEIESLVDQCLVELRDPRNHSYSYSYVIYGRKP